MTTCDEDLPSSRLIWAVLGMAAFMGAGVAHGAGDPRFFGTYCGTHTETVPVPSWFFGVPVDRNIRFAVRARVKYRETRLGNGLISGTAVATVEDFERQLESYVSRGDKVGAGFVGVVKDPGQAVGTGTIRGRVFKDASAVLDGESLSVRAGGYVFDLSKARCENEPPTAEIRIPDRDGMTFDWGRLESLHGTADDDEDDISDLSLEWTSDRDARWRPRGLLAQTQDLSPGSHRISFTVTDSGGRQSRAVRQIMIANERPNAPVIEEPPSHAALVAGQCVQFRGRASDPEEGNLSAGALVWTSDRAAGSLGIGNSFVCRAPACTLETGAHTVTLTATDRAGATRAASIPVSVEAAPGDSPPEAWVASPPNWHTMADHECVALEAGFCDFEDTALGADRFAWTVRYELGGAARVHRPDPGRTTRFCPPEEGLYASDTRHEVQVEVTNSRGLTHASAPITILVIPGGLY